MIRGREMTEFPSSQRREGAAGGVELDAGDQPRGAGVGWKRSLAAAIRDPDELIDRLRLPESLRIPARAAALAFPLVVPESYLARMEPGRPGDPLLRQVLPLGAELESPPGYVADPVGDAAARRAPGLLHKYHGRALLLAARECAVHCRYCFRRHYPYQQVPADAADWTEAIAVLRGDPSVQEVILSGGDPLVLSDRRLQALFHALAEIPHVRRLRIHSRLPIVLPDRINADFIDLLRSTRLAPVMVVHANHPREIAGDCADALRSLVAGGVTTLNQCVLLAGVNDSAEVLAELSERLFDCGVLPYYLHQLDRVAGAAHFEIDDDRAKELMASLRSRLPGYLTPRLVREIAGAEGKQPLG
jgi:EF-P beta-lysylation protein EpmB